MITGDPMRAIAANRGATYWPQNLRYLLEVHGMNYWKYLCLQWQASTGKRCTKADHTGDEGTYKNKLECEAQLVESITVASQGAYSTCKKLSAALIQIHKEMGCDCDWRPKLKPPIKETDK